MRDATTRLTNVLSKPWVPLLVIATIWSVTIAQLSPSFATSTNMYVVFLNAGLMCAIGLSQIIPLSVGEFTLANAGVGSLSAVAMGYALSGVGLPLWVGVLAALVVGGGCGLVNGVLVAKTDISGFILTLASGGAFAGLALGFTQTKPFTLPESLTVFGTGRLGPLPILLIATIILCLGTSAFYRWGRVGRLLLAVGGNAEAATLSGLSKSGAIVWAHSIAGVIAGAAGVMAAANLHEASSATGSGWVLTSLTVAIIGGTRLNGGSVSIGGLFVASLILALISNSLVLLNVNPYWVTLAEGVFVLVAVIISRVDIGSRVRNLRRPVARKVEQNA